MNKIRLKSRIPVLNFNLMLNSERETHFKIKSIDNVLPRALIRELK